MSGSRSLRSAFEACRPSMTSRFPLRYAIQRRTYADSPSSDTQSVPKAKSMPEKQEPAKKLPGKNPSSRASPASAKSASANAQAVSTVVDPSTKAEKPTNENEKPVRPIPANVLAAYRKPMKHEAEYGVPVASLQLRSYSVRSLEFFSDFALRAAYYLNLPASGPVPLPKRIERWTMPRSNFVHKKSQENFERITYKRLITIMDGHHSAVEVWLAVLRKWQFFGVGMKANVWAWEGLDVASKMDAQAKDLEKRLDAELANFGWNKTAAGRRSVEELLQQQGVKQVAVPMANVRPGAKSRTLGELAEMKAAKST